MCVAACSNHYWNHARKMNEDKIYVSSMTGMNEGDILFNDALDIFLFIVI